MEHNRNENWKFGFHFFFVFLFSTALSVESHQIFHHEPSLVFSGCKGLLCMADESIHLADDMQLI